MSFPMAGSDLQQRRRCPWAGVEENARDRDTLGMTDAPHGYVSFLRNQSCKTKAEYHGVRTRDLDGVIELINAGCEDEIFVGRQCFAHFRSVVIRTSDEEILDGDGRPGCGAARPSRTRGVELHGRDEDVVLPTGVDVQVG